MSSLASDSEVVTDKTLTEMFTSIVNDDYKDVGDWAGSSKNSLIHYDFIFQVLDGAIVNTESRILEIDSLRKSHDLLIMSMLKKVDNVEKFHCSLENKVDKLKFIKSSCQNIKIWIPLSRELQQCIVDTDLAEIRGLDEIRQFCKDYAGHKYGILERILEECTQIEINNELIDEFSSFADNYLATIKDENMIDIAETNYNARVYNLFHRFVHSMLSSELLIIEFMTADDKHRFNSAFQRIINYSNNFLILDKCSAFFGEKSTVLQSLDKFNESQVDIRGFSYSLLFRIFVKYKIRS